MSETAQLIVAVISAAFASSGFWAFMTARMTAKSSSKKDNDLEKKALMGLLHQELKTECKRYLDRGEINLNEYEDLRKYIFEPYKALGGNGTAEELMGMAAELLKNGKE